MKTRISIILTICVIFTSAATFGANRAEQFSISPVIGGYTFDGKQHLDTNLIYGARAGYNVTDNFGIEALFDYVNTEPTKAKNKVDMYRYGGELLYHFIPENTFVPYLAVGLSGLNYKAGGVDKKPHAAIDYGLGAKYFVTDNFALRGDVRHIIYSYSSQSMNNLEYTIGAYIPFGGVTPAVKPAEPPPAPTPAPKVVEPPPPLSAAPTAALTITPATVTRGQSVILNWNSQYASKCDIQPGIGPVPTLGVKSITPDDSTTYNILCTGNGGSAAGTAHVTVVASPPAAPVPAPLTPKAAAAAKRFCNKPAILNIEFDSDKSDIKSQYKAELKNVGEFLRHFPKARGEISGHTDSTASPSHNQKLSQRRAASVAKYISATFGINPGRISTKGYGEARPVASNKTREGRAKNRRIEANFTCE